MPSLKRFGGHANLGNKPHQGHGQWKKSPPRMKGLMAGSHVAQRTNTGDSDRHGMRGVLPSATHSGAPPKLNREFGHYHPEHTRSATKGVSKDVADARQMEGVKYTPREIGRHTGKTANWDQSKRKGPVGNGVGSAPPGVGAGPGRRGTPDTHLGTAGRGGSGRLGKHDAYKGKSTPLAEEISHEAFEKLGSG